MGDEGKSDRQLLLEIHRDVAVLKHSAIHVENTQIDHEHRIKGLEISRAKLIGWISGSGMGGGILGGFLAKIF